MANTFLVSDTHFSHSGVCKFVRDDGTKLRPWDNPEEMDEYMVQAWNETVRPKDKVYHLGDVVINRKALRILDRLNGDKVLIKGNHDIFKLEDYTPYFRDIRGSHVMNHMILTHIPVHIDQLYRFGTNIHGHLHYRRVMKTDQYRNKVIDENYYCVCVEHTEYRPIALETVFENIRKQGGQVGAKHHE
jgi:calcineurin-like phosphoesterase family protein